MNEMVTSVKFAPETQCVNAGLTFNFRSLRSLKGDIYPSDRDHCAVAGIAQTAEVWFPYNRWDR